MRFALPNAIGPPDALIPAMDYFEKPPSEESINEELRKHPQLVTETLYLYERNFELSAYISGSHFASVRNDQARILVPDGPSHQFAFTTAFWRGVCDQRATLFIGVDNHGKDRPTFKLDLELHVLEEFVEWLIYEDDGVHEKDRSRERGDPEPFTLEERERMTRLAQKVGRLQQTGDQAQKIVWLVYRHSVETEDRHDGVVCLRSHLDAAKKILAWKSLRSQRGYHKLPDGTEIELYKRGRPRGGSVIHLRPVVKKENE
jgi:hypothetical protein